MKYTVAALLLVSTSLSGTSLGVDFDQASSNMNLGNPPWTLGWSFQAVRAVRVSHLGFYDSGQDGLIDDYPVGLWNSSGTLLASATVSSGTSDLLVGKFRMVDITDVLLESGETFRVGALFTTGNDKFHIFTVTGFVTDPNILFVSANQIEGGTLSDPVTQMVNSLGHFGPNILLADVPEPSTGGLTLPVVVALAVCWRLRRGRDR